eukprot:5619344-Ditylum_brightwellii.AAC.1
MMRYKQGNVLDQNTSNEVAGETFDPDKEMRHLSHLMNHYRNNEVEIMKSLVECVSGISSAMGAFVEFVNTSTTAEYLLSSTSLQL